MDLMALAPGFWCSSKVLSTKDCLWCRQSAGRCWEGDWRAEPWWRSRTSIGSGYVWNIFPVCPAMAAMVVPGIVPPGKTSTPKRSSAPSWATPKRGRALWRRWERRHWRLYRLHRCLQRRSTSYLDDFWCRYSGFKIYQGTSGKGLVDCPSQMGVYDWVWCSCLHYMLGTKSPLFWGSKCRQTLWQAVKSIRNDIDSGVALTEPSRLRLVSEKNISKRMKWNQKNFLYIEVGNFRSSRFVWIKFVNRNSEAWFAAQATDFVQLCGSQKVAWSSACEGMHSMLSYAVLFGTDMAFYLSYQ